MEAVDASLSVPQRKVVRLLAWGEPPTGAAAARLGLSKGSAAAATKALVERSLAIAPEGAPGPVRLVDPLLAEWTRRRRARP
jgi:hypothetical protein